MPRKKKVDEVAALKQEVIDLKAAIIEKAAEANAFATATSANLSSTMVPVKNYSGNTVAIPYEYNGRKNTLMLETLGIRQTGALPLEQWIALERESDLVKLGYIARTDRPITNPNIIEDLQEFIRSIRDKDIDSRLGKIDNDSILSKLNQYLELLPEEQKTGKVYKLLQATRSRIEKLTGVRIVDSDILGIE